MKLKYIALLCTTLLTTNAFAAESWYVQEGQKYEWKGYWTKKPNGTFHADMSKEDGERNTYVVQNVEIIGPHASMERRRSWDGNECDYRGIKDGNSITGTGQCFKGPTNIVIQLPGKK